jgi:hypothetical protein
MVLVAFDMMARVAVENGGVGVEVGNGEANSTTKVVGGMGEGVEACEPVCLLSASASEIPPITSSREHIPMANPPPA